MTIYFQSSGTNNVHQCVRLFGLVLTGSNVYPSCYLPLSRQPAHNDGLPARSSVIFRISTVDSVRAVDLFRRRERRFGLGFYPHLRRICFFRQREDSFFFAAHLNGQEVNRSIVCTASVVRRRLMID